jgi:hypothetical protein
MIFWIAMGVIGFAVAIYFGHTLWALAGMALGAIAAAVSPPKPTSPMPSKRDIDRAAKMHARELERAVETKRAELEERKEEPVTDDSIARSRDRLAKLKKRTGLK